MDEIVLKWVTVLSGILTVIVCVSVFFFPDIHERAVLAAEQQKEVGGGNLIYNGESESGGGAVKGFERAA